MDIDYHADIETDYGPGLKHSDNTNTSSSKQQCKQKMMQQTAEEQRTRRPSLEGNDLMMQKSKTPMRKQSSIDEKKLTHKESTTATVTATGKPSKSNSSNSSWSVTKKKHQQTSGQVYRSQSGSTLHQQQQHDSNSRLPVVKSCSGKCNHVIVSWDHMIYSFYY